MLNALILRGEPVMTAALPSVVSAYLNDLVWNPGFDRSRLSTFMS
jgi:hypothetical protein